MLTGKLVRVRYARSRIVPYYIDRADASWQAVAERLLELFRGQEGHTRGQLEDDVQETFGSDPRTLVHQGLAKLLEDRCEFEVVSGHPPEQLRERVFRAAADARKVAAPDRVALLQSVAEPLGLTVDAVDKGLFADLKSEQCLARFKDISAERLLELYNAALAQAVLLRAVRVTVHIRREPPRRLRQLLRLVKFHRLICEVTRAGAEGYTFTLDGPLSLFSATQKYGLQLALFLPAILTCRDYEVEAELRWGPERKPKTFHLDTDDGVTWPFPAVGGYVPPELAMFADLFRKKALAWDIHEETDVLPLGDGFWVPDYRLIHKESGKTVYLEVLGFWRKASAEKHLQRLRQHALSPFVLAVSEQLHIEEAALEGLPAGVHRFRQMPLPDEIARLASTLVRSH